MICTNCDKRAICRDGCDLCALCLETDRDRLAAEVAELRAALEREKQECFFRGTMMDERQRENAELREVVTQFESVARQAVLFGYAVFDDAPNELNARERLAEFQERIRRAAELLARTQLTASETPAKGGDV